MFQRLFPVVGPDLQPVLARVPAVSVPGEPGMVPGPVAGFEIGLEFVQAVMIVDQPEAPGPEAALPAGAGLARRWRAQGECLYDAGRVLQDYTRQRPDGVPMALGYDAIMSGRQAWPCRVSTVAIRTGLAAVLVSLSGGCVEPADYTESFERASSGWTPVGDSVAKVVPEPEAANTVLELRPLRGRLSYVVFSGAGPQDSFRMTGRFLFPTEGDGYLGFVYGYQSDSDRIDYGCVYVKSNGSYIRFSPHFDGNPSWRLYEDLRVDLEGDRAIRLRDWHDFKLEVIDSSVSLYIDDMTSAVFTTDVIDIAAGMVGLEARPGGGEPAWVDDIRVRGLDDPGAKTNGTSGSVQASGPISGWRIHDEILGSRFALDPRPVSGRDAWTAIQPDGRGAIITAQYTQRRPAGAGRYLLSATLEHDGHEAVLAFSSANSLDVWLNGERVGEVEPVDFIRAHHTTNPAHEGTHLSIRPRQGSNELLILVDPDRFAAGGFFVDVIEAGTGTGPAPATGTNGPR